MSFNFGKRVEVNALPREGPDLSWIKTVSQLREYYGFRKQEAKVEKFEKCKSLGLTLVDPRSWACITTDKFINAADVEKLLSEAGNTTCNGENYLTIKLPAKDTAESLLREAIANWENEWLAKPDRKWYDRAKRLTGGGK